jgi:hypothetical protein
MFRTPWSFRVLLARYGKSSINYLDRSGVGQQAGNLGIPQVRSKLTVALSKQAQGNSN